MTLRECDSVVVVRQAALSYSLLLLEGGTVFVSSSQGSRREGKNDCQTGTQLYRHTGSDQFETGFNTAEPGRLSVIDVPILVLKYPDI